MKTKVGKTRIKKHKKHKKKSAQNPASRTLDEIMTQPGVDLIINASLALNASRARRKRVFVFNRSSSSPLNMSQKLLRLLFIATIVSILILSVITVVCISQALIYSNYECILADELKMRRDSVGIEIDRLRKHLSPCLYCFR